MEISSIQIKITFSRSQKWVKIVSKNKINITFNSIFKLLHLQEKTWEYFRLEFKNISSRIFEKTNSQIEAVWSWLFSVLNLYYFGKLFFSKDLQLFSQCWLACWSNILGLRHTSSDNDKETNERHVSYLFDLSPDQPRQRETPFGHRTSDVMVINKSVLITRLMTSGMPNVVVAVVSSAVVRETGFVLHKRTPKFFLRTQHSWPK